MKSHPQTCVTPLSVLIKCFRKVVYAEMNSCVSGAILCLGSAGCVGMYLVQHFKGEGEEEEEEEEKKEVKRPASENMDSSVTGQTDGSDRSEAAENEETDAGADVDAQTRGTSSSNAMEQTEV
jgi:hypothetical protein